MTKDFKERTYGNGIPPDRPKHSGHNNDLQECFYCFAHLKTFNKTVDHMLPESRGGVLANDNKVPCCFQCNAEKQDMTLSEWAYVIEWYMKKQEKDYMRQKQRSQKILYRLIEIEKSRKPTG